MRFTYTATPLLDTLLSSFRFVLFVSNLNWLTE